MTGTELSALPGLVGMALIIAVSPITVIPAILVLHSLRPRPTSVALLLGWTSGLVAVAVAASACSGLLDGTHRSPPVWVSWARIGAGLALVVFGVFQWRTRHRSRGVPRWMGVFVGLTPSRAVFAGAVLTVIRPEVLVLTGAAGLAAGHVGLESVAGLTLIGAFVVVAASTVAAPTLAYLFAGQRLDEPLERLRRWMEKNHAAMMGVILALIGVMVTGKGVLAL